MAAVVVGSSGGRGGILGWFVREARGEQYLCLYDMMASELRLGPRDMARKFLGPGEATVAARRAAARDGIAYVVEEWSGRWASPVRVEEGTILPSGCVVVVG